MATLRSFRLHSYFSGPFISGPMALLRSNNLPPMTQKASSNRQLHRSWACSWHSVLPRILYTDTSKFSSVIFSVIFSIMFFIIFVYQPSTLSTSIVLFSIETDGCPLISFFLLSHRNRTPGFCLSQMTAQNRSSILKLNEKCHVTASRKCPFCFLFESLSILLLGHGCDDRHSTCLLGPWGWGLHLRDGSRCLRALWNWDAQLGLGHYLLVFMCRNAPWMPASGATRGRLDVVVQNAMLWSSIHPCGWCSLDLRWHMEKGLPRAAPRTKGREAAVNWIQSSPGSGQCSKFYTKLRWGHEFIFFSLILFFPAGI